jgi:hypothetical protein
MREIFPPKQPLPARDGRFYKMQIKGWVDFDPTGRELNELVNAIENGGGFVTVLEVTEVANRLVDITDPEIRERFANVVAVDRILRNAADLPSALKEKLQRALGSESSQTEKEQTATKLAS